MSRRLRLLKVMVQPIFVVDDDEGGLSELIPQAIEVSAQEWPTIATERFAEATAELRLQVEDEQS
jgi:hypothetical protein